MNYWKENEKRAMLPLLVVLLEEAEEKLVLMVVACRFLFVRLCQCPVGVHRYLHVEQHRLLRHQTSILPVVPLLLLVVQMSASQRRAMCHQYHLAQTNILLQLQMQPSALPCCRNLHHLHPFTVLTRRSSQRPTQPPKAHTRQEQPMMRLHLLREKDALSALRPLVALCR